MTQAELAELLVRMNSMSGAALEVAKALDLTNQALNTQYGSLQRRTTVEDALTRSQQQQREQIEAARNVFGSLVTGIQSTINGFVQITSQLYSTTGAFSQLSVGMDAFFLQAKNVAKLFESLGGFLNRFAGWVGILGGVTSGLSKLAQAGLDTAQTLIKFNLEGLQRQYDIFVKVNQAGLTFGGSLQTMRTDVMQLGINLQAFGKVIQDNIENFATLGIGLTNGAKAAIQQARTIGDANGALLRMYGNFESLATGAAEYMALQAQIGVTDIANQKDLTQNITNYLITQRQLTELTGQSADALRRQEQERRKELAYQDQLRQLGPQAQENMRVALGTIGRMYGPLAEKYAKEFFSTGGNVISREGIRFASMMGPAADSIAQILGNIDQNAEDFQDSTAKTIKLNNQSVQAAVDTVSQSGLAALAQAGYGGDLVAMITTVGGHIRSANEAANQIEQIVNQLRDQAARIRSSGATTDTEEDRATATAIRNMNRNLMTIDQSIGNFAINAPKLVDVSQKMIDKFLDGNQALNGVVEKLLLNDFKLKESAEALGNLAKAVGRAYGFSLEAEPSEPGQGPSRPQNQTINELEARLIRVNSLLSGMDRSSDSDPLGNIQLRRQYEQEIRTIVEELRRRERPQTPNGSSNPQQADGGIATGPTTVGEAGPEAVIPLRQGSIPVNINFDSMLAAMSKQQKTLDDMVYHLRDSVEIQERLLRASA